MRFISCLLFIVWCSAAAYAQPVGPQAWWPSEPTPLPFVHTLFTDDMVLQRDIKAPIWGWSTPGDSISISFDDQSVGSATAGDDGKWLTRIGPFKAGGPHTLTISGRDRKVTLGNVLCGDVWLCSGQSNMNWPVRLSQNAEEEVKNANNPQIRSFTVNFFPSIVKMKLPPAARWEQCVPDLAKNFTGVGYFFAREIQQTQKIPVGIIHSSVGATAAEVWVSPEALERSMPFDFPQELAELKERAGPNPEAFDYFAELQKWTATVDPESARLKYSSNSDLDTNSWQDIEVPKPWEEAGLADFDGLVWFRREFDFPAHWASQDLALHLSIINDYDLVWFNGQLIGGKQLPKTIRNYVLKGSTVRPGKNVLVVAILNREGPGGFCSAPNNMALRPVKDPNDKSIKLAGTWKAKIGAKLSDIKQPYPEPKVGHYKTISSMYNGMIHPLEPFAIKGALWYQGEANGPRWLQYRRLLPALITHWREQFQVGDFPFLIVSLANYNPVQKQPVEPGWAEIRESMMRTVQRVANTGISNTIDIGGLDIHPRNKQEVGRRLSLVARHLTYGEKDLIHSGPVFSEMQIEPPKGDRIRLYFKHLGGGLMIRPGDEKLQGFVVAGPDKNFVWADAVIEGDTIVVSSPEVPTPKYVRYGWAWNPTVNLYNKAGLPAFTFRTDE